MINCIMIFVKTCYMNNMESKSQGIMLTVGDTVPSPPIPFPQFHFSET